MTQQPFPDARPRDSIYETPALEEMVARAAAANRVVPAGEARERAEALAREIAAFPPNCVMSDRRSVYETFGMDLPAALAREFELGRATIDSGESLEGAARFAGGAGRHGAPAP